MSIKNSMLGSIGRSKADVKRVGHNAAFSSLMEALARLGYGVRGLIYITVGLLALDIALGKGGAPADQQGAIATIGKQPAGMLLLWVILIGLVSYSLWGVVRAVWDPLNKGHDTKGLLMRGGYLFSAVSYAILILPTYSFITGAGRTAQSGAQTQKSMASIMSKSWGPWVIGLIGLAVVAVGLHEIYQGFKASFDRQFQTYAMTAQELKWAIQLGRFGTAARGIVFVLVGGLISLAAYHSNPNQPVGIDAALKTLMHQSYGVLLLGIVAVGLMAFGVFSLVSAAWFRLRR